MSIRWRAAVPLVASAVVAAAVARAQDVAPLLALAQRKPTVPVPQVDGAWWRIASSPDLGELTGERQEPVDFAIWQAADGTWQLWSCIRGTACGGQTRLFFRWEARRLTDRDWKPMGIAMQADPALGETPGGLQAPFVFRADGRFQMVYGDWKRICRATSTDGKRFERWQNDRGEPDLFAGPLDNARDPMVRRLGELWCCYYTAHREDADPKAAVFCRTSHDLATWSEPLVVCAGGEPAKHGWFGGNCECPFVLERDGTTYLFRNLLYGANNVNLVYASKNPFAFGVGHDRQFAGWLPVAAPEIVTVKDQCWIAALEPGLDGIRVAKMKWVAP